MRPRVLLTLIALCISVLISNFERAELQAGIEEKDFTPDDYASFLKEVRHLAELGNAEAQVALAEMYRHGFPGLPQDNKEAVRWYRQAADQGDPEAQRNLGLLYEEGEGTSQDYVQAYIWYNLAAAAGNREARVSRDRVTQRMTPAQIAEAQHIARQWTPKHGQ